MNPLDRSLAQMREEAQAPSLADAMAALGRWDDPARHTIGAALTEREQYRALLLECRTAMSEDDTNPSRRTVTAIAKIDWVLAGD